MKNNVNDLMKGMTLNKDAVIYVLDREVFCDGILENSKHPRVFLKAPEIEESQSQVICPYCKQVFIYKK